jgi:hypothetical protein
MEDNDYDYDNDNDNDNDNQAKDNIETENKPENHPIMKKITADWKLIGIISAFVNRLILEKIDLNRNLLFNEEKKIITSKKYGDPIILNVTNVDVYSLNLFRQIHRSFDIDLKYFGFDQPNQEISDLNELTEAETNVNNDQSENKISQATKDIIEKLLIGLITLNEQTVNFIADGFENLYDQKTKNLIEYFLRQRDYYLSIGRVKVKYDLDNQ